jgi:hypothetical protein
MRFDARELAVSLRPRNRAQGCQGGTESPAGPDCGACTPATTHTGPDDGEPTGRCDLEAQAGQLGLLRVQLGEALSQPGAS